MEKMLTILVTLIAVMLLNAENGYVYIGDLNEDGLIDSIKSGPKTMFGNGGGPFIIWLGKSNGESIKKVTGFHPKAVALEKNGLKSKLWTYGRMGSRAGSLGYTILDSTFERQSIYLHFDDDDKCLSKKIYDVVFSKENLINFKEIENYTPPEYHWGK